MATTPVNIRLAKSRTRRAVLEQTIGAGATVLDRPDILMRNARGELWAWTYSNEAQAGKWTRLQTA